MNVKALLKKNKSVVFCYLMAFVLFAGFSVYMPGFASPTHIRTVFLESALIGIVAVGQTLVIITGGIDLSVAWMMTIGAYIVSNLGGANSGKLVMSIVLMLAVTFGLGAINGFCISCLRVPAIVMTLGMNIILKGALVAVTQGSPGQSAPDFFLMLGQKNFLGIPYLVIIWLVLTVLVMVMLFKMKFGRKLFAIGNNATVAQYSGIRVNHTIIFAYAVSGLTAGIAGALLAGKVGSCYLAMGDTYQFQSIAAVAIGGTSMLGGKGNYLGTVAGALTITILLGILVALNLPFGVQRMAYGLIVLVSVIVSVTRSEKL